ncbi:MAG: hypothetical protein E6R03_16710 [Hyphomicrobiaceae bacterium]|nr:MAG: hypothetical protein E6R03_16710 [Hyphomicrobiaceae bacterium]
MTDPLNRPNLIAALPLEAWWLQPNMTQSLSGVNAYQAMSRTAELCANLAERLQTNVPEVALSLLAAAEEPETQAHLREYIYLIGAKDYLTVDTKRAGIEPLGLQPPGLGL